MKKKRKYETYTVLALVWKRNIKGDKNPLHTMNKIAKHHLSKTAKKNRDVGERLLNVNGDDD